MKSKQTTTFGILIIFMIIGMALAVSASPKMEISEDEFSFGVVPQHARVSHVFWIKSTGDDTLKITKVEPGCGCTKVPLDKTALAPGDSTRLEVIFSTRSYTGQVSKAPKIHTNAPERRSMVRIYAKVIPKPDTTTPIVIMPYKLDVSKRFKKAGDQISFAIKNVSDKPVGMKLVDQPDGYWGLSFPDKIEAGQTVQVAMTANDAAVASHYEKSFTIELDDEARTRFSVPVKR